MIYQSILTEAAEKSKAQEARALEIEKQRRQELHQMAAEIDLAMDRRRQRKSRVLTWDYFRPLIEELKGKGASDNEIAKELCEQGFSTSRREVYTYTVNNGLRTKSEAKKRPSKLDPHIELIKQMRFEGFSLAQMAIKIRTNHGVNVTSAGVADFIRSRGI